MTPLPKHYPQLIFTKFRGVSAQVIAIILLIIILTIKSDILKAKNVFLNINNIIDALNEEIIGAKPFNTGQNIVGFYPNKLTVKEGIVFYQLTEDKPIPLNLAIPEIAHKANGDALNPVVNQGAALATLKVNHDRFPEEKRAMTNDFPWSMDQNTAGIPCKKGFKVLDLIINEHRVSRSIFNSFPPTNLAIKRSKTFGISQKPMVKSRLNGPSNPKVSRQNLGQNLLRIPRKYDPNALVLADFGALINPRRIQSLIEFSRWPQSLIKAENVQNSQEKVSRLTLLASPQELNNAPYDLPPRLTELPKSEAIERLIAFQIIGGGLSDQDILEALWPKRYRFKGPGHKVKGQGGLYLKSPFINGSYLEFGALGGQMIIDRKVTVNQKREGQRPKDFAARAYNRAFLTGVAKDIQTNSKGSIASFGRVIWRSQEEDTLVKRLGKIGSFKRRTAQTQVGFKVVRSGQMSPKTFFSLAVDYDFLGAKDRPLNDPLSGFPRRKGWGLSLETGFDLTAKNGRKSLEFLFFAKAGGRLSVGGLVGYSLVF
jgi:hypothetical protein